HSAVGLRRAEPEHAEVGEFAPGFGAEAAVLRDRAPALEGVAAVDPSLHRIAQLLFVVAEFEVHGDVFRSSTRFTRPGRSGPRCCAAFRWSRRRSWSCGS